MTFLKTKTDCHLRVDCPEVWWPLDGLPLPADLPPNAASSPLEASLKTSTWAQPPLAPSYYI